MKKAVLFTLVMLFELTVYANEQTTGSTSIPSIDSALSGDSLSISDYPPPPSIKELPGDVWEDLGIFVRRIDPKKNYKFLLGLTASTLVLVKYDQEILDESKRLARRMGLISESISGREGRTLIDLSVGGLDIPIRIPSNANATLYFIGDGLTHLSIAGGLAIYGALNDDNRSLESAGQVMESILTTGIIIQILKRSFGRESPYASTADGGRWRPFPSFSEYASSVPHYDAFPSGHLATAMATVTVLAGNYPEKTYINPVGYTLMALNAFGMMNNGVHWAADYPLGLAIGWLAGDIALERGKKRREHDRQGTDSITGELRFESVLPFAAENGGVGVLANFSF